MQQASRLLEPEYLGDTTLTPSQVYIYTTLYPLYQVLYTKCSIAHCRWYSLPYVCEVAFSPICEVLYIKVYAVYLCTCRFAVVICVGLHAFLAHIHVRNFILFTFRLGTCWICCARVWLLSAAQLVERSHHHCMPWRVPQPWPTY